MKLTLTMFYVSRWQWLPGTLVLPDYRHRTPSQWLYLSSGTSSVQSFRISHTSVTCNRPWQQEPVFSEWRPLTPTPGYIITFLTCKKNYMLHSSCISKKNYTTVFCFSLLTTRWPTVLYPKATMPTCSAFNKMESSGLLTLWPLAQMLSTLWVNLTTMSWFSYLACLKLGI